MYNTKMWAVKRGLLLVTVLGLAAGTAQAEGNIDSTNKYAWGENVGWINFAPTAGGVALLRAKDEYLTGYAWGENIGWIKLGSDAGGPYLNSAADNWGVNISGKRLHGYAWSETCGWIKFDTENAKVTVDWGAGKISGYAWGENIGWIHFSNESPAYGVVTLARWWGSLLFVQ